MIKLIASDLDGTLLTTALTIPEDFFEVLHKLQEKGIMMVAASGRDLAGAAQFFGDEANSLMYICDNGANIYQNGKLVQTHNLDRENILTALRVVDKIPGADPILCGTKGTYVAKEGTPVFINKMKNHYSPVIWVDDLHSIDDDIFKLSIYDVTGDIRTHCYEPVARALNNNTTIHISSNSWVDIMSKSADKGVALKQVQEQFGISYDETMAFGDFYNDEPLLKQAKYAFVMENGMKELKDKYPFLAKSNNEWGVTHAIKNWVLKDK